MARTLIIPLGGSGGGGGFDPTMYYTKSQVDALIQDFITRSVNDLVNYYTKSETYTQAEVNTLIGSIESIHFEFAASTSDVQDPQSNVIYLIGPSGTGADQYEEYVYANNQWKKIGDTSIDLSNYATLTDLQNAINTAMATLQQYTVDNFYQKSEVDAMIAQVQTLQGIQGIKGADGVNGVDGLQGIQGIAGQNGANGQQGIQGIAGQNGTNGVDGSQGIQGIKGADGVNGVDGSQGIQGIKGADGVNGVDGSQGIQGIAGQNGSNGEQGIQGIAGSDGINGEQGIQGIAGANGVDGVQGIQGVAGTNGVDGVQGIQGIQGITGPEVSTNKIQAVVTFTDSTTATYNIYVE